MAPRDGGLGRVRVFPLSLCSEGSIPSRVCVSLEVCLPFFLPAGLRISLALCWSPAAKEERGALSEMSTTARS